MRNPYIFQLIVAGVVFFIALINLYLGKSLLLLSLTRMQIVSYLIVTIFLSLGMFSVINGIPFAAQISRFCVFWFVAQIIILPFAFILIAGNLFVKYFTSVYTMSFTHNAFLVVMVLAICSSAYGAYYESVTVRTVKYDVSLQKLDTNAEGFKIAQITDLHIGHYFSTNDLQAVMEKVVAEKPAVLVITGDLIDDVAQLQETVSILDKFAGQFPHGIYYCWGNHEYFRNYAAIGQALNKSKVTVLKNQHALLVDGQIPLYLLGIDYSFNRIGGAKQEYEAMLVKAIAGTKEPSTKILLSHHSVAIDNAFEHKIELTLTGHTHGLQVNIVSKIFAHAFKYLRGMYEQDGMYGYVSTGVSGWFPFRFGCPPEIAVFTLKKV